MRTSVVVVGLAVLACPSAAPAQVFNEPRFYVKIDAYPPADQNLVRNVRWGVGPRQYQQPPHNWYLPTPEDFADEIAWNHTDSIFARMSGANPTLQHDRVAIELQGFAPGLEWEPHAFEFVAGATFFDPTDAMPNMPPAGTQWPNQAGITARAYRHPFTRHASTSPAENSLRDWMERFCARYKYWQAPGSPYHGVLPDPAAFHFDVEGYLWWPADNNGLFMLAQLAERNDPWQGVPTATNYWNRPVPGCSGASLNVLYDQMRIDLGNPSGVWPADAGGVEGILLPGGIDPTQLAGDEVNRPYMLWFSSVCQRAQAAVLDASVWQVVRDPVLGWGPGVKCSNYGESRLDHLDSYTGWFMDWNEDATARIMRNRLPRALLESHPDAYGKFPWANVYGVANGPTDPAGIGRWLSYRRTTFAEYDAPELYTVIDLYTLGANELGWDNDPLDPYDDGLNACYQQPNLYLFSYPPGPGQIVPLEDRTDITLRLARHELESIIEGCHDLGTAGCGNREWRVVPWIEMVGSLKYTDGSPLVSKADGRRMLALLRSKNIHEILYFKGNGGSAPLESWNDTSQVIKEVYAPRIEGTSALFGLDTTPPAHQVPETLEFTLRWNGTPWTMNIESDTMVVGGGVVRLATEAKVLFSGLQDYPSHLHDYTINIECDVSEPGVYGRVYVYDWLSDEYVLVEQLEGYDYGFYTPDRTTRRTCTLVAPSFGRQFVDTSGLMQLKLVHYRDYVGEAGVGSFTSRYDLVQVIPHPRDNSIPPAGMAIGVPPADLTYDDTVDADDVIHYTNMYSDGVLGADMDLSGDVTAADLSQFLDHYNSETP